MLDKAAHFMEGHDFVKTEERYFNDSRGKWKSGYQYLTFPWNIRKMPYHVSLSKSLINEYLFVIEIDSHTPQQGKKIMKAILDYSKDKQEFFCKYSGNKGFHIMCRIVNNDHTKAIMKERGFNDVYTYAKAILISIYEGIKYDDKRNPDGVRVSLAKEESDIDARVAWLDIGVHQSNHMVRGLYSYHFKSKRFSIPIDLSWSVETIIENSKFKNIEETFNINLDIPEFVCYKWGEKNIWEIVDKLEKAPEFDYDDFKSSSLVVAAMIDDIKESAPACMKVVLTNKGEVQHHLRIHTTIFLKSMGYSFKKIIAFWNTILSTDKFDHVTSDEWEAINMVFQKDYNTSCEKLALLGLCVGRCEWHKKRIA